MATSDITGRKNRMMTVIGYSHTHITNGGRKQGRWKVQCDCGSVRIMPICSLSKYSSCGCQRGKNISIAKVKHGCSRRKSKTAEYRIWGSMLNRCNNPKNPAYPRYGGRGITVCDRWHTFDNFLQDMGVRPQGTSLDRINNNKGYCAENCKWSTQSEQQNNKSSCRYLAIDGVTKTIRQWSKETGINPATIAHRLNRGISPEIAIKDRQNRCHRIITIDGESKRLAEWARASGINQSTIALRIKKGMNHKDAVFMPVKSMSECGRNGAKARWN